MKKIIINESQLSNVLLKEAMTGSFNKDVFDSLPSFAQKAKYCKALFGSPIGNGSSRIVYQIDDYRVFKLAWNEKGVAQNEQESAILNDYYLDGMCIFPQVYKDSDTENYSYIVADYVIPAKNSDFKKILGLSFKDVCEVIRTMDVNLRWDNNRKLLQYAYERDEEFWSDVENYMNGYDIPSGDLCAMRNWGLSPKNGGSLVILDSGLNNDIFDNYYRPK